MDAGFQFGETQFNRLFPFYLQIDRNLKITSLGSTMAKLCRLEKGADFERCFFVKRPETRHPDFERLLRLQRQLIVMDCLVGAPTTMRGQFEYLEPSDSILFIGSPWFGSMDQVRERELTLHDFAYHDPLIDLLHVLKTQEIVNSDIKDLLDTVNKQRKDLKQLSLVAEQTANAVIITNEKGQIEWVNHAFEKITGYTLKEVAGGNPGDILQGPETDSATVEYMGKQIQAGKPFNCELINYSKSGKPYWVLLEGQAIRDKSGKIVQYFALQSDITQEKHLEQELKTSYTRMATLISNLHAGIMLVDQHKKVQLVNRQFCKLFHLKKEPEALIGKDFDRLVHVFLPLFNHPEAFMQRLNTLEAEKQSVVDELMELADGRVLSRDFLPIWGENRKNQGFLWVFNDHTERIQNQKALEESEEKYRGMIENMELGLLEVDMEQRIVRPYRAFCDMVGYEPEELIGKSALEVLLPAETHAYMRSKDQERSRGTTSVYEMQLLKKDGSTIWTLISGAPIKNSQGEVIGSIGIHYDITARKKLEGDLAEARKVAEQARLAERQFLANMSHEIRTPMNAVIGMTHLLYETQPTPQQKDYLDSLRFSADNLLGLIDNILDLSKIEAGELEFEARAVDLQYLFRSLQQTYQFKVRDKAISVVLDFDPAISNMVICDSTRLSQIMNNLLGNASKFTEKGTIGIRATLLQQQNGKYEVEFCVHDTGIGIPEDKQGDIFGYFKQANVNTTRRYGGTGLGLTIVKQLVELQGGSIRVESKPNAGSQFIFTLTMPYSDVSVNAHRAQESSHTETGQEALRHLEVLAVEDNAMNQKLISRIFENWGVRYTLASNGLEGLETSLSKKFDIILMDIHMPEMDGCDATQRIRTDPGNPNCKTPIIALTAAALLEEKRRALESGMNDFLTKPFSPKMLETCIKEVLHLSSRAAAEIKSPDPDSAVKVDLKYLQDLSGGDDFFVRDMIEAFLEETPPALERLTEAIAGHDWEKAYEIVHKLKPNLGMLGMKAQEKTAAELEMTFRSGRQDAAAIQDQAHTFIAEIRAAFPLLKGYGGG